MVFCNNANLLNVFVRHIANNQLRSLAEVATVAHQLKLLKDDFFASDQQAVAVADRYPQDGMTPSQWRHLNSQKD